MPSTDPPDVFEPTPAGLAFPVDDLRRYFRDDERQLIAALDCADLQVSLSVGLKLAEYQGHDEKGRAKRAPRELTPEQEAREARAEELFGARARAHGNAVRPLILRIARLRWQMAGSPRTPKGEIRTDPSTGASLCFNGETWNPMDLETRP